MVSSIQDKIRFDAMSCKDEDMRNMLLAIADALDKGASLEECRDKLKEILDTRSDAPQAP